MLEEGKPRQIVGSAVELPPLATAVSHAGVDSVSPDVVSNDISCGRIVVIFLDPFLQRVMVPGRVTIADPPGITALWATAVSWIIERKYSSMAPAG